MNSIGKHAYVSLQITPELMQMMPSLFDYYRTADFNLIVVAMARDCQDFIKVALRERAKKEADKVLDKYTQTEI